MPGLIGKTLGPYRIIEQIGLGGMATVYKAYQPAMDRYVALKVLSIHLSQDPTFVKRFAQEARVIARLEHAHILPVYDHGEEDDYLYLVMRFIEAGTLKERLASGPLSVPESRRIVAQVGSALEYAHRQGIIHRDLKPSNVLIDREGDCYLTDFGIAKMVEGTMGLTGSGIIGTPHYMAPEQGQSAQVDQRTDIYAMGVVIYEMVTGRVPFDAETPFAVVMKHMTEPLPLPRQLRPELPEAVERVILKAMAKSPADRYQSMRDLVAAFELAAQETVREIAQAGGATAVSPAGLAATKTLEVAEPPTLAAAPPTRMPAWLLAAAGLALVLLLVVAGIILSRIPGRVGVSGGQAEATLPAATDTPQAQPTALSAAQVTATATPRPTPSATPMPSPTSSATPVPTLTPLPTEVPTLISSPAPSGLCRIAYSEVTDANIKDIYITDCDGSNLRWLTDGRISSGHEPAWSPDGQRLVFDENPNLESETAYLYTINADGTNRTPIVAPDGPAEGHFPVWPPDGSRIAWQSGCAIMTIHPDGSDKVKVFESSPEFCVHRPMWSPDSQRFAFSTFPVAAHHDPSIPGPYEYHVYVVNADGTGLVRLHIFMLETGPRQGGPAVQVFWSPEGTQVTVEVRMDDQYTMRYYLMNSDGSGEMIEVDSIPESWHPWYWPQWGRPAPTPTPTSTSTETPTAIPTPTRAQIPTPTPAPTDTPTPGVSSVYMEDDGKGHRRCEPDTVTAGRIVVRRGIGRWPTPEEARAAVGDSWPPITANAQALVVTGLERSDVEWHATGSDDPNPGWGFHASVEIQLGPGVYSISSLWLQDLKDCTLTVTEP